MYLRAHKNEYGIFEILYLGERRKRFRRNEGNPGTYSAIEVKLK
jgi:hypothetical protein